DLPGVIAEIVGEMDDRSGLLLDVDGFLRINPAGVEDASLRVADGHDPAAQFLQKKSAVAARVAKALNGDGGSFQGNPQFLRRFPDGEDAAEGGRFIPSQGTADNRILAGDDAGGDGLAHAA